MEFNGYETITTFWEDFSIADKFGASAVRDTYKRGLMYAKTNYKYLTELVMVLNWKMWQHYEQDNKVLTEVYEELWAKCDDYACEHLKGEELEYFYKTTD